MASGSFAINLNVNGILSFIVERLRKCGQTVEEV